MSVPTKNPKRAPEVVATVVRLRLLGGLTKLHCSTDASEDAGPLWIRRNSVRCQRVIDGVVRRPGVRNGPGVRNDGAGHQLRGSRLLSLQKTLIDLQSL